MWISGREWFAADPTPLCLNIFYDRKLSAGPPQVNELSAKEAV